MRAASWRRWRNESRERRRAADHERKGRRNRVLLDQAALEARCASVVGEVLERVVYVELDYGSKAMWDSLPDFDSVDHGVELSMESGRTFSFFWDDVAGAEDFGINVTAGTVPVEPDVPHLDVTESSRWSSLVGRSVTACRVIWRPVEGASDRHEPQTIRLDFGDERVLVTAFETGDGVTGHSGADHVTVFFGDSWERRSDLTADIHASLD